MLSNTNYWISVNKYYLLNVNISFKLSSSFFLKYMCCQVINDKKFFIFYIFFITILTVMRLFKKYALSLKCIRFNLWLEAPLRLFLFWKIITKEYFSKEGSYKSNYLRLCKKEKKDEIKIFEIFWPQLLMKNFYMTDSPSHEITLIAS